MIMRISMPNRFRLKKVMGFRTMIRPERGEIHYIGGADILPAPLSLKEETEALNKFGTEEEKEAKAELIEHNLRLVVYIAKKFDNTSVGVEDLISIGKLEVSIDEPLNVDWDGNELLLSDILGTEEDVIYKDMEDEVEKDLLKNAVSRLSPRERKIVELRYGLKRRDGAEMTQKEVADLMGISQSYISRLEKKIMMRLKKEIVKFE